MGVGVGGRPHSCNRRGEGLQTSPQKSPAAVPDTCRKRAVEAELHSCRARLRTVEAQLLEVLQEKLKLKQEVEAWEVGRVGPPTREARRTRLRVPRGGLEPALALSLSRPQEDMQLVVRERVQSQLRGESRGALGTQGTSSAGGSSRILSRSQWGRWW